jgi:D-aspartate ligase
MAMISGRTVDTSTPAVVLKFDRNVMHHGGLGAIRSLGRAGVPVYGVHETRFAPAAQSRYLRGRLVWQPDPEDAERTAAGLRLLAERIGRPAVLIPTDDAGAIFLAEHGEGLRGRFLFPEPPAVLPREVAGKHSLSLLCRKLGVPGPRAMLARSATTARAFAAETGFPLIAKLAAPWRARGLRSTTVCGGPRELAELMRACQAQDLALLLQEYIPASPGGDWFFHGYCDAGSACRPAFTGVKDRSYPAHAGLTSLGRAVANDGLREHATRMLAKLGYQGVCDLDFRRDPRDGQYKLLDFNPRLGAQFRLLRDRAGLDVVIAAYLDLTGQPFTAGEQLEGRRFLVENYDPLGALRYWRDGELAPGPWLRSVRGIDEAAWFARDDLRPFGLMCARMGWRAVSRPLGRWAERRRGAAAGHESAKADHTDATAARGGEPRYWPARTPTARERPPAPGLAGPAAAAGAQAGRPAGH